MSVILSESERHLLDVMQAELKALREERDAEAAKPLTEREPELVQLLDNKLKAHEESVKTFVEKLPNTSVPGAQLRSEAQEGFSLARMVYAVKSGDWSDAPYEAEVDKAMRDQGVYEKAQSLGTDSAGGYLVPEMAMETIIDRLRAGSVVFQRGATEIAGLDRSPVVFPRLSTSTTATWAASEGATITDSSAVFDEVTLSIKELSAMNYYSNMLLRTSHPSIDAVIRDDFANQMAEALDLAALSGSGASGQPTGIDGATGVGTVTIGSEYTYDLLLDFINEVRKDDALRGNLGWVMSPTVFHAICQMKDGDNGGTPIVVNQQLGRRLLAEGPMDTVLGYPYSTTSQIDGTLGTASETFFGNWADLLIGRWGALEITSSAHHRFGTNQGAIRAVMYADVAVRHGESFCVNL